MVLARRRWILVAGALVLVPVVFFASRVSLDFDVERYFPEGDTEMRTFREFKGRFRSQDGAVSLFWREKGPVTEQTLTLMAALVEGFQRAGLTDLYWTGRAMADEGISSLKEFVRRRGADPFFEGLIWNHARTVHVITGFFPPGQNTDAGRKDMERRLQEVVRPFQKEGRRLVLTGEPVIRAKYLRLMAHDQILLIGGGVILTFLFLFLYLGSVVHALLPLVAVTPSYLIVLALLALTGRPITAIMSMLPLILLVVGLSDALHILMPYRARLAESPGAQPRERQGMVLDTFREIWRSCFLTSLTTALGFGSLILSGIAVIVDFSIAAALGIMLTFGFSMVLFPVILAAAPAPKRVRPRGDRLLRYLSALTLRRAVIVLVVTMILSAAALAGSRMVHMESHILNDLRPGAPLRADLEEVQSAGFGVFQVNVYLPGVAEGIAPSVLHFARRVERFVRGVPFVTKVVSLNTFLREGLRRKGLDFDPTMVDGFTPSALKEQADALTRRAKALESVYDPTTGSTQIMIFVKDAGSKRMEPFLASLKEFIKRERRGLDARVTGTVHLTGRTYTRLMRGFSLSLGAVGVLIFFILLLAGRSLALAVISLPPNLLPLLGVLGVAGFSGYELSPASLLVFAVALSLVVDDTVHLLTHLTLWRHRMKTPPALFSHVFNVSGRAVMLTSVVISAGFAVMMLSSFQTIFDMGFLIVLALAFALAGDLLLLPALYVVAHRLKLF